MSFGLPASKGLLVSACALLWALPALAQDFTEVKVEKFASDFRFTEGPVWSREGTLIFSDVPSNRILEYYPGKPAKPFRENSGGASGNALDSQGRLYTCEGRARRVTRTDKKGKVEVLAEKWEGKRLNAPNDIVVRKDGHIYFTDPAFGYQSDARELDFYGVYHLTTKQELKLVAKPAGRPNGITLSPDGRILYVSNSDERNVRAYDLDRNGETSNERVVISKVEGPPDGMRTDEKGNLYVAANKLLVYSPEGKLLTAIEISEKPSNCVFGGADGQTLYITARTSLFRVRLGVKGATP